MGFYTIIGPAALGNICASCVAFRAVFLYCYRRSGCVPPEVKKAKGLFTVFASLVLLATWVYVVRNALTAPVVCVFGSKVTAKAVRYVVPTASHPICMKAKLRECGGKTVDLGCEKTFCFFDTGEQITLRHLGCKFFVPSYGYRTYFFGVPIPVHSCVKFTLLGVVAWTVLLAGVLALAGALRELLQSSSEAQGGYRGEERGEELRQRQD